MGITTEAQLRQFLHSKDVPCDEVDFLEGGSANFCWRIKSRSNGRSIIKHAEPYIRIIPDVPLPQERIYYEQLTLECLATMLSADEKIRLPRVHEYFPDKHLLHMSDGGALDLRQCYKTGLHLDFALLAQRIGLWLARLHNATSAQPALSVLREKLDGNATDFAYQYPFKGVASVLEHQGFDPALGERINAAYGSESVEDKVCLCHGDFWLSNIQVADEDTTRQSTAEGNVNQLDPVLTIIDWENARVGNGATDVGRFAADAWLVDRFYGGKGMFSAFLTAYLAERPLSEQEKIRLTVYFAVHIIFYSRMRWTDDEGTKKLVQTGKGVLEAVESGNQESLATGPLMLLYSGYVVS
ncbi:uncharacterized protein PV09_04161 [Verruconis gallopava]|uniref:Uncharacterized protein n=1 Tax=Verruconis gallopava TaxID=253628 RepID=A0A0D2ADI1_9PEZI|nr:uncharacterized protein PV09_04161 [Verruconis gallopava]KIW05003.1 hypothetical protein PV09_04161 [Verruconis gallopava]